MGPEQGATMLSAAALARPAGIRGSVSVAGWLSAPPGRRYLSGARLKACTPAGQPLCLRRNSEWQEGHPFDGFQG